MAIPRRQDAVSDCQPIKSHLFQSSATHKSVEISSQTLAIVPDLFDPLSSPFTPEIGDNQFSFTCIYFDIRLQLRGISAINYNGCSQKSQEQAPH
jgi:hypothetical protein